MKEMTPSPSTFKSGSGPVDLGRSAKNVEKSFIGTRFLKTYNHKLVMLMDWMFDFQKKHLEKSAVLRMKKATKLNKGQARAAKLKKKGKEKGKEERKKEMIEIM